jgi:hypothetical protein
MTMGTPGMHGGQPTSAAQHPDKSFPAETDPGGVAGAKALAESADSSWREDGPQLTGSPVQPEIRQDTPVADMGEGYREAAGDDPQ